MGDALAEALNEESPPPDDRRHRRSTVAIYSDELRFSIIDAVFKRPFLWDSNANREATSLVQRKQAFTEIANSLSTQEIRLSAKDVEKQWKNLKDTYNKVKKKVTADEYGLMVTPRWRFFNTMLFLDQVEVVDAQGPSQNLDENGQPTHSRKRGPKPTAEVHQNGAKTLREAIHMEMDPRTMNPNVQQVQVQQVPQQQIQHHQQVQQVQQHSHHISTLVGNQGNEKWNTNAVEVLLVPSGGFKTQYADTSGYHETEYEPPSTSSSIIVTTDTGQVHFKNEVEQPQNQNPSVSQSSHVGNVYRTPEPYGVEDEYASFCKSLIYPLRDLGMANRMEYLKLQKNIRDAVYEAQMRNLVKNEEIKVD
uniref:MADF domain-containing protein n=1 Tax=Acrobeloides nanus TaxID=290746 RepID=A0A914C6N0_9BILA